MDKRDFLKDAILFIPAAGLLNALARSTEAEASTTKHPGGEGDGPRYGMGIEVEKCIGCNRCVEACKAENGVPQEPYFFRT
ncbi:MAG TPA: 4Fe-4S binding protein, partial [Steroidobacteraceae bacterium]|nr:4Fe-4S binding protein [Steroidobacteraceae bacterium]